MAKCPENVKKVGSLDGSLPKVEQDKTDKKLTPELHMRHDEGSDTYTGIPGDGIVPG